MDIGIIVILVILSSFFSASETAFSTVNVIRLRNYADQGNKRAERALKIAANFDKALTTILVGNNIVNIAAASLATVTFTKYFGKESVGMATLIMTVAVLIFGEILPKSFAKENADAFSIAISGILGFLMFILTPITKLFMIIKSFVTKTLGRKGEKHPSVTEEELKYIIEEIEDEGVLEEQESELVKSALEFDETEIEDILTPRVNIMGIEVNQPIEEIKEQFFTQRYSRMPVYEKTMDNVIGIINQKDFFQLLFFENSEDITSIIQEPFYISEYKKISAVLSEMQHTKTHMAIVVDEYGGTAGLVTMEDIIEELVGEIYDENDEDEFDFQEIGENYYQVSGGYSISDFLENLELPEDCILTECNSIGGWIMECLEHIPEQGERIKIGIFDIKVTKTDEQKIEKVRVRIMDFDKDKEEE